jgi:hypothetical protein
LSTEACGLACRRAWCLVERVLEGLGIDLGEDLVLRHAVVEVDKDRRDLAGDFGADLDLLARLHLAPDAEMTRETSPLSTVTVSKTYWPGAALAPPPKRIALAPMATMAAPAIPIRIFLFICRFPFVRSWSYPGRTLPLWPSYVRFNAAALLIRPCLTEISEW